MKSASEAFALLVEGNQRYLGKLLSSDSEATGKSRGHEYIEKQRLAGNILAPSLVGSVEFAAAEFGARLVVILGHRHCGAIGAAVKSIQQSQQTPSPNINAILDTITDNVAITVEDNQGKELSANELNFIAMRANVIASAELLRKESPVLAPLIADEGLRVVGAEFDIETGIVEFFDGVPITA